MDFVRNTAVGDREELAELRRLEELEARAGTSRPARGSAGAQVLADPITQGALNPAGDMAPDQRFLAGVGKTFTDLGQGAQQIVGGGPSEAQVDERRDRDVSLMATPGGFGGSLAGGVAATLPMAAAGAGMIPAIAGGASYGALQPTGTGESRALNTALGAGTAGAMKFGLDKAVPALAAGVGRARESLAPANARAQELGRVLKEGRELGLKVSPSQSRGGAINKTLESISGKAATQQKLSQANQDAVYSASQRHAGVPPNQALTADALSSAREIAAEPYRMIASSSPRAAKALERWKAANFEKNLQFNHFKVSKDPKAYRAYEAAKEASDAALDEIDRMPGITQPVMDALKAARVQIAKIHTVEKALRGSSINPKSYARAAQRGEPISGELGTMARFANDFPQAMAPVQQGGAQGVSKLAAGLSPLLGTGGYLAGGPAGVALAAAPFLVPPVARGAIMSGPYQAAMTAPKQMTPALASLVRALQRPEAQGALPAAGAMYAAGQ